MVPRRAVRRDPEALPATELAVEVPASFGVPLEAAAKLAACAAHASQLGFQFGGETAMRDALHSFARDEGTRFGTGAPSGGLSARTATRLDSGDVVRGESQ